MKRTIVLLAAQLCLAALAAAPAEAQQQPPPPIWTATLTAKDLGSGPFGCDNTSSGNECSEALILTDDDFNQSGTSYSITAIRSSSSSLLLSFSADVTSALDRLAFCVGTTPYVFQTATHGTAMTASWPGGQTWTVDQSVSLSIGQACPAPTVSLVLSPASISEDGGVSRVTATLSGAASAEVTVTVSAAAVPPAVSSDFTLSANKTLTIARGSTRSTGTVTITAVNNNAEAAAKTVTVSGTASGGGVSNPADRTLTITDDDGTPTVSLSAAPNPVTEGSPVTVTAILSRALLSRVVIPLTLTRNTAEADDFGTLASITVAANATVGTGQITTVRDTDTDADEFTVALGALPSTVAAGTPSSVRIRINETSPGAPTNLAASASTGGTGIEVSWRAPANTGSSAVARYVVYGGRSNPPSDSVGTSTSTEFTLTPVAPGTTYYFRVRAVNADGLRGPLSGVASFTTAGGADATKVRGLSGLGGRRQIALAWQAPAATQGLRRYRVQVASASGGPFTDLADTETALYVHADLPDGATRWYRVAAVYGGENLGTWSEVASATTNGPPSAPRDLTATKGVTRVKLRWQAPASTGGFAIDRLPDRAIGGRRFRVDDGGLGRAERDAVYA